jgi:hypothetical protein
MKMWTSDLIEVDIKSSLIVFVMKMWTSDDGVIILSGHVFLYIIA